jgi:O-antigen/teichoic acid export membrane protein
LFPSIKCAGKVDEKTLKELLKKVVGMMLYKISGVCRNSFDSIIISSFLGLVVLAQYQNYYYIMNAVSSIIAIVTTAATASIGNSIATETVEKNLDNFKTFSFLYNWIASWCTVCLLCLYQPFMKIWVGEDLLFSFDMVVLFCIYFYSCKVSDILFTYRQAAGLWWEDKLRPIIESVANLVLNILLVKYFGVCGVVVSTIVTIVFINIPWGGFILFKHYFKCGMKKYLIDSLFYCVVVIFACAVTFVLCNLFKSDGIILLLERFLVCLIIPNIFFYLAYRKLVYFNKGVNLIKKIFKK